MCSLISSGIVLTKQVIVKPGMSETRRVCVAHMSFICFLFLSARSCDACVSHQPSVTVEVTSEPWRACTAREAF